MKQIFNSKDAYDVYDDILGLMIHYISEIKYFEVEEDYNACHELHKKIKHIMLIKSYQLSKILQIEYEVILEHLNNDYQEIKQELDNYENYGN
jgi:hypothetical protein